MLITLPPQQSKGSITHVPTCARRLLISSAQCSLRVRSSTIIRSCSVVTRASLAAANAFTWGTRKQKHMHLGHGSTQLETARVTALYMPGFQQRRATGSHYGGRLASKLKQDCCCSLLQLQPSMFRAAMLCSGLPCTPLSLASSLYVLGTFSN